MGRFGQFAATAAGVTALLVGTAGMAAVAPRVPPTNPGVTCQIQGASANIVSGATPPYVVGSMNVFCQTTFGAPAPVMRSVILHTCVTGTKKVCVTRYGYQTTFFSSGPVYAPWAPGAHVTNGPASARIVLANGEVRQL